MCFPSAHAKATQLFFNYTFSKNCNSTNNLTRYMLWMLPHSHNTLQNAYWYYIVVLYSRSLPFVLFNCGLLQPPLRHCKWSPFYAFPFAIIKAVRTVCPSNPLAAVQMASENGLMSHPTHPSFGHSRDFLRSQNKATRPRTSFHRWIALS